MEGFIDKEEIEKYYRRKKLLKHIEKVFSGAMYG